MTPRTETRLETVLGAMGANLLALRKAKCWSQRRLAEKAGLDRTYISAIENGKQNVSIASIVNLATALDAEIRDIMPMGANGVDRG